MEKREEVLQLLKQEKRQYQDRVTGEENRIYILLEKLEKRIEEVFEKGEV